MTTVERACYAYLAPARQDIHAARSRLAFRLNSDLAGIQNVIRTRARPGSARMMEHSSSCIPLQDCDAAVDGYWQSDPSLWVPVRV